MSSTRVTDQHARDRALTWSTEDAVNAAASLLAPRRPAPRPAPPKRARPIATTIDQPPTYTPPAPAEPVLLNRAGRPRTPATMPGARLGHIPASKGKRYRPDPVTAADVDAILKHLNVPRCKYENRNGAMSRLRLRALIAVLWRSGLRISEALALEHRDLNHADLCLNVRHGKGDKQRISAMDEWGWNELDRWLAVRDQLPNGPVFCVISGTTAGDAWCGTDVRRALHRAARAAGVKRRVAPHQFRHAHAVDLWRDGIDVFVVQRQLGHARLDVTAQYLSSISPVELLEPIGRRRPPLMPIAHA